jgi:adenosylcobinamide kinase/adenosylcobinamide-phosphate guanylyltransferase
MPVRVAFPETSREKLPVAYDARARRLQLRGQPGFHTRVPFSSSFEEPVARAALYVAPHTVNLAGNLERVLPFTLVLGGARSGKSAFAQSSAEAAVAENGGRLVMIATAQAFDSEMVERIARHREDRGSAWTTLEAPLDLAGALGGLGSGDVVVVDCLTLWLSNLMLDERDLATAAAGLVATARRFEGALWLVSNEVGFGIVPDNALARRFRDEAGRLHQALAQAADAVTLVVAGLTLRLK